MATERAPARRICRNCGHFRPGRMVNGRYKAPSCVSMGVRVCVNPLREACGLFVGSRKAHETSQLSQRGTEKARRGVSYGDAA